MTLLKCHIYFGLEYTRMRNKRKPVQIKVNVYVTSLSQTGSLVIKGGTGRHQVEAKCGNKWGWGVGMINSKQTIPPPQKTFI